MNRPLESRQTQIREESSWTTADAASAADVAALHCLQHGNDSPLPIGRRFRSFSLGGYETLRDHGTATDPGIGLVSSVIRDPGRAPDSPDGCQRSGLGAAGRASPESGPGRGRVSPPGGSDGGGSGRRSRSTLSREQVVEIYGLKVSHVAESTGGRVLNAEVVARRYGVTGKTIRDIWKGRTWFRDTFYLDGAAARLPMPERFCRHPGRPKGSKDSKPRKRKGMPDDDPGAWPDVSSVIFLPGDGPPWPDASAHPSQHRNVAPAATPQRSATAAGWRAGYGLEQPTAYVVDMPSESQRGRPAPSPWPGSFTADTSADAGVVGLRRGRGRIDSSADGRCGASAAAAEAGSRQFGTTGSGADVVGQVSGERMAEVFGGAGLRRIGTSGLQAPRMGDGPATQSSNETRGLMRDHANRTPSPRDRAAAASFGCGEGQRVSVGNGTGFGSGRGGNGDPGYPVKAEGSMEQMDPFYHDWAFWPK